MTLPSGILAGATSFTIATWVRVDTLANWARLFDFGSGTGTNMFLVPRSGSGTARYAITAGGAGGEQRIDAPAALPAGVWTHVAVTHTGNLGILYVNGAEVARNSALTSRPSSLGTTTQNWIGRSQYSGDPYLNAAVDSFRVYSRALSASRDRLPQLFRSVRELFMRKRVAIACGVVTLAAGVLFGVAAQAANPVVTAIYTADPAPLVVGNTMYIYAGRDEASTSQQNFVMREWHVLSSTDAATWTDHGARANIATFPWAGADAWASEVEPRNGRYYWYTSVNGNGAGWMNIGVAVGDSPLGPFTDAKGGPLISDSTANSSGLNIDPTVFVDDDGQAYMYWGGYWAPRAVRLASNMIDTVGAVVTPQGLTNYWEAPFMFKRNGLYYMIYAANDTERLRDHVQLRLPAVCDGDQPDGAVDPPRHRARPGLVDHQPRGRRRVQRPVVHGLPQRQRARRRQLPPVGGRRPDVLQRRRHDPAGRADHHRPAAEPGRPDQPPTNPPTGTNLAPTATRVDLVRLRVGVAGRGQQRWHAGQLGRTGRNLAYGNWPQQGTQWIEYQWPSARSVNRVATYWFDDNQGIDLPASCQVQYWNGSAYVAVPGQSACGVAGEHVQLDDVQHGQHDPVAAVDHLSVRVVHRRPRMAGLPVLTPPWR